LLATTVSKQQTEHEYVADTLAAQAETIAAMTDRLEAAEAEVYVFSTRVSAICEREARERFPEYVVICAE
jgi:hypothetical protein